MHVRSDMNFRFKRLVGCRKRKQLGENVGQNAFIDLRDLVTIIVSNKRLYCFVQ